MQQPKIPKPKTRFPAVLSSSSTKSESFHMVEPPDVENVGLSKLKSTPPVLVDPNFFVGCVHDHHHLRGKVNEVEFVCRTVSCSQSVICFYVFFFVRKEPGLQSWRDQRQRFQCQVHIAFSFV